MVPSIPCIPSRDPDPSSRPQTVVCIQASITNMVRFIHSGLSRCCSRPDLLSVRYILRYTRALGVANGSKKRPADDEHLGPVQAKILSNPRNHQQDSSYTYRMELQKETLTTCVRQPTHPCRGSSTLPTQVIGMCSELPRGVVLAATCHWQRVTSKRQRTEG